ncbi:MAG: hypothetical protein HZC42_10010 [Candidatus Eisenbacteria bacterium]|nr:hypothetical protein [Candidatus Eisenbacteria bacterium]
MDAYMYTCNGIDVSGYYDITVAFDRKFNTEPIYDYLSLQYSSNGVTWSESSFSQVSGTSSGWPDNCGSVTVAIPGMYSRLYLRFLFHSDGSVHPSQGGAYVDHIVVRGSYGPRIDCSPTQTFNAGTPRNCPAGRDTFVDYTVVNFEPSSMGITYQLNSTSPWGGFPKTGTATIPVGASILRVPFRVPCLGNPAEPPNPLSLFVGVQGVAAWSDSCREWTVPVVRQTWGGLKARYR